MRAYALCSALIVLAGCRTKPPEPVAGEVTPPPVAAVRGSEAPVVGGNTSSDPLVTKVREGIATMDQAQKATDKLNARIIEENRSATDP